MPPDRRSDEAFSAAPSRAGRNGSVVRAIVRSEPTAEVLVVNLERCGLNFQEAGDLERRLAAMLFGDGWSAAMVSGRRSGAALHDVRVAPIPESA